MGSDTVKIAAAIAAGYLIGRTRKARFVLAMASGVMMAGSGLARMGLDESKLRGVLTEVLGDVQRSAGKALNARAERFSDSLHSQTEQLNGVLDLDQDGDETAGKEEDDEASTDRGRARDQADGDVADGDGEDREARRTTRRSARHDREPQGARGRR